MTWSKGKSRYGEHETEPRYYFSKRDGNQTMWDKTLISASPQGGWEKSLYEPIIVHHDFPLPGTFSLSMPPLKGNRTYL